MKRTVLLLAVTMLALLLGGGAALAATQTLTDGAQGVEASAGQFSDAHRVGVTFVGQASGQFPALMYASLNYAPPQPGPKVVNTIFGGGWSLKGPKGVLFGTFTGGDVRWNAAGTVASVNASMAISGGSVMGEPVSGGSGSFAGSLTHLTFPPTIQGTLTLAPS